MENHAPNRAGLLSSHFLIKSLFFTVLVFVGVVGGVYVGTAISNRPAPFETTPNVLENKSYLKIGEVFPDYELTEYESTNKISVSELTRTGPTLMLIVSPNCEACKHIGAFFKRNVSEKLRSDIKILMVVDVNESAKLKSFADSLAINGAKWYVTDRSKQSLQDGIHSFPSVIGLDKNHEIKFLMTGYSSRMNANFINKYL